LVEGKSFLIWTILPAATPVDGAIQVSPPAHCAVVFVVNLASVNWILVKGRISTNATKSNSSSVVSAFILYAITDMSAGLNLVCSGKVLKFADKFLVILFPAFLIYNKIVFSWLSYNYKKLETDNYEIIVLI